ncbi:hypothetical protein FPV67DRAFT_641415 [Lyophyllum atratum]|nr:hypothetical protein FPV67DRAFT_641415 [Lyophyllum atratum]
MPAHPPQFLRNCSALAAFTLLLWDGLINADHEYQHIWDSRTGAVKHMYLFSRYYGIFAHIANLVMILGPLNTVHNTGAVCAAWFGFNMVSFLCLIFTLEVLLSLRLYALYQKNRKIGALLVSMTFVGVGVSVACGLRSTQKMVFKATCVAVNVPYDAVYFSMFTFLRHTFIWMLTIRKRNVGRIRDLSRAPIVRLMLRDGAWIFAAISAILTTMTPYCVLIPAVAQTMIPWSISFVSVLICRLILNMQRLQTGAYPTPPELTTNVDFDLNSEFGRHVLIGAGLAH